MKNQTLFLSKMIKTILSILYKNKNKLLILLIFYIIYKYKKTEKTEKKKITTITTNNILIWNPSNDTNNPTIAFKESALTFLKQIKHSNLYLISIIQSIKQKQSIIKLFEQQGLFDNEFTRNNLLFCE